MLSGVGPTGRHGSLQTPWLTRTESRVAPRSANFRTVLGGYTQAPLFLHFYPYPSQRRESLFLCLVICANRDFVKAFGELELCRIRERDVPEFQRKFVAWHVFPSLFFPKDKCLFTWAGIPLFWTEAHSPWRKEDIPTGPQRQVVRSRALKVTHGERVHRKPRTPVFTHTWEAIRRDTWGLLWSTRLIANRDRHRAIQRRPNHCHSKIPE